MQVEIFKIWQHLNFCFPGQCCWEFEILILSFSLVYESKSNFSIYKFSVMSKQNKNSSNHWVSILILRLIYLVTCTKIQIGFILARSWQSVTKRNKDPLDFKNSRKTWQFTKTNTVQWLQGETVVRVEKLALFSRGARRSNSTSRP